MVENLKFRRQFILKRSLCPTLDDWVKVKVDKWFLYAHPDLPIYCKHSEGKLLAVLGEIYDPFFPTKTGLEILDSIFCLYSSVQELLDVIKRFCGRFLVVSSQAAFNVIIPDALALRELYFNQHEDNEVICASQPTLIKAFAFPQLVKSSNEDLVEFFEKNSTNGIWKPFARWIGDETIYEGVKHLLPNFYLDLDTLKAVRFWPNKELERINIDDAVSELCRLLEGALRAMSCRHSLMMAVTAGLDSRTLLAASRGLENSIYYFIDNHGLGEQGLGSQHPDIAIPRAIFSDLGIPFHVEETARDVPEEFCAQFFSNYLYACDRILPSIYNTFYKKHSDKVNVLGIGEIGRTRFGDDPSQLNVWKMAYKMGLRDGSPYVMTKCKEILEEQIPAYQKFNLCGLTGFYWEQTLGNWGSTGNSESDIAIEEVNPMNSRLFYEICLSVDPKLTKYHGNTLFRLLIKKMWPELLNYPINPPNTFIKKIKKMLANIGAWNIVELLREKAFFYKTKAALHEKNN